MALCVLCVMCHRYAGGCPLGRGGARGMDGHWEPGTGFREDWHLHEADPNSAPWHDGERLAHFTYDVRYTLCFLDLSYLLP
jgi:hypothetical protein